jgi:hypothetical protein
MGLSLAMATWAAPAASADGRLSPSEQSLGDAMAGAVCDYFYSHDLDEESLTHIFMIVNRERVARRPGDAIDVINYIVSDYCPDYSSAFNESVGILPNF